MNVRNKKKQAINFKKIEEKWQKQWADKRIFEVKEDKRKKKFYVLAMFPYPSGSKLHMGHAFNYTVGDIYARFKRMQGFNVLYPIGYDSFGLPAENAAINEKKHPSETIKLATNNYTTQLKRFGLSYDWSRMIRTSDPDYYKWNQFFFLKFLEKGLMYRKRAPVNWCPRCNTVLANEQVHNGKCWRHEDTNVEIKHLEQWFMRTTDYAEELLDMIDKLDWPERIKTMQRNWIGKSKGAEITFEINGQPWSIFTTRPDTIFGVTFMVISAQHERLSELVTPEQKKAVESFLKKLRSVSEKELESMDKEGVFTGSYAVNPINGERIPVYAGNFVVADYGSGIVMAVPSHDQRDFEFAEKYDIPIKVVVEPEEYEIYERKNASGELEIPRAYPGEGTLVNSGQFNGMTTTEARKKIVRFLENKGLARPTIQYKMRDWLISRQRYWGTPIPIIYCDNCGVVPVLEKNLPVKLPEKVGFGKGNPLETNEKFLKSKCPKCGGQARRETDTMDTFFDSSWYYIRFTDPHNDKKPFDLKKEGYWMPVDHYIGGAEHATMHLIYARAFMKALRDLGFLEQDEPFVRLFNQGMLHGEDGYVMSKSRGNGVYPDVISDKYGIDTARLFLVSIASPDKDIQWSSSGIEGSFRFVNKVISYFEDIKISKGAKSNERIEHFMNKAIKDITGQVERMEYNLAVIRLRELFSSMPDETDKATLESFLKLLSPFCPHIAEELWSKIGNKGFIGLADWPSYDEKKINSKFDLEDKALGKVIGDVNNIVKLIREKSGDVKNFYLYVMPQELDFYKKNKTLIENRIGLKLEIFAVNDKNKYDPDNKAKKAKPGRPGIYVE